MASLLVAFPPADEACDSSALTFAHLFVFSANTSHKVVGSSFLQVLDSIRGSGSLSFVVCLLNIEYSCLPLYFLSQVMQSDSRCCYQDTRIL